MIPCAWQYGIGTCNRDRCDKSIAATGHGFNKVGAIRGISQSFADLVNRHAQALVELNVGVFRPEMRLYLFPRDNCSSPLNKQSQQTQWLILQPHLVAAVH
jgi:hypothetical protein